jgi:hypothetical protein
MTDKMVHSYSEVLLGWDVWVHFQRLGVGHIVSFFPVVLLLLMFPCSPRRLSNGQLHARLEDVQFLHPINSDLL